MDSNPDALNDVLPSYSDFSDPNDDSRSDMLSFDKYDMFGLVDNPNEIVFACPNTSHVSSIDDMTSDPDPSGDAPASMGDVMSVELGSDDGAETSLARVINTCPTSTNDSEASSVELVHHQVYESVPDH